MCDCSSIAVADTCTQCCTVCYTNTDANSVTITCANGTALVVSDCRPVTCADCGAIFLSHKCSVRNSHTSSHGGTIKYANAVTNRPPYCRTDRPPYCRTVCYTDTDAHGVADSRAIFLSHAHSDVHTVSCSYCGSDFVPYKAPNNHQLHKWPTRWRRN